MRRFVVTLRNFREEKNLFSSPFCSHSNERNTTAQGLQSTSTEQNAKDSTKNFSTLFCRNEEKNRQTFFLFLFSSAIFFKLKTNRVFLFSSSFETISLTTPKDFSRTNKQIDRTIKKRRKVYEQIPFSAFADRQKTLFRRQNGSF